jgi:hypothetical protein
MDLRMEHCSKFLKGIALSALASMAFSGAALAVPTPTYPQFDPGSGASATTTPRAATVPTLGARTLFRSNDRLLTRANFRAGGDSIPTDALSFQTTSGSRSKTRYVLPGLLLAVMAPLALHHPGDNTVAIQTQTPASPHPAGFSPASLGDSNGHGRDNHPGGDDGNANDDHSGDGGDDPGDVSGGGDHGSGGDDDSGGSDLGGDDGGGDHGGGGDTTLPEPGTVPLVGAGLMMALAFRSRRDR